MRTTTMTATARTRILACVTALALTTTACGADRGSSDNTASEPTVETTAAASPKAADSAAPAVTPSATTAFAADPTAAPAAAPTPAAMSTPTAVPAEAAATPAPAPSTPVPAGPTAAATPAASEPSTGATIIAVLDSLTVQAEHSGSGFVRADFEHHRGYLCDSQGVDPYTGVSYEPSSCDVDHIVAAQEAFESGGWEWAVSRREAFGNDALNLVPTRDCVNRSKGARDMAEWSGRIGSGTCAGLTTTPQGRCYMASKVVEVKAAYSLSVDASEKDALAEALDGCPPGGPAEPSGPSGFQTGPNEPPPTQAAAEQAASGSDCHPAYSPCLPNLSGDALNCGDLTAAQRPVTVLTPGTDPYQLDRDGDGRGCTS
ncbi:MAG: hypothetical protein OXI32_09460 [bacterium]|nr:hypothetical protein [bacterium]